MKPKSLLFLGSLLMLSTACTRKDEAFEENYQIILVMGQSNTHYGQGYDPILDAPDDRIKQLGRFDRNDMKIIEAKEPLEHRTKLENRVGIALTFAKLFANRFLEEDKKVLIVPAAVAGSSFASGDWNRGDEYYDDAVERLQWCMTQFPSSELSTILWHQGESDANEENENYQQNLDQFIRDFREDIQEPDVPFILGGMVPSWANNSEEGIKIQEIIKNTPKRLENTYYVDPTNPFTIQADPEEPIHYDAKGVRELGRRYFEVYSGIK